MIWLLPLMCFASTEEEISRVEALGNVINHLLQLTENNHLNSIIDHLIFLEAEFGKTESTINAIEENIGKYEQSHAQFNTTEAMRIRNLMEETMNNIASLEKLVKSVSIKKVEENIPQAIVGMATADSQASNSVTKIKQESYKLENTVGSNSKFLWVWSMIGIIVGVCVMIYFTINKATSSSL
jgi:hypothetical protein